MSTDYVSNVKMATAVKAVNDKHDDISEEFKHQLMNLFVCLGNAETISYKMSNDLEVIQAHSTMIHRKKAYLNRAVKISKELVTLLSQVYDEDFMEVYNNPRNKYTPGEAFDGVQHLCNLALLSQFVLTSRDNMDGCLKALLNFKQGPDFGDVESTLKRYKIQRFK